MTIINMSGGRAGKTPVYQSRNVTPTQFPMTVQPQEGYDALSSVQVNAPANLLAQNIRKDVNIAGVVGTYEAVAPEIKLQQKTVMLDGQPVAVTPDSGYDGLSQVSVAWDNRCSPGNIRSGVTMFGVTGTYTGTVPSVSTYDWYPHNYVGSFGYPALLVGRDISVPNSTNSTGTLSGFLSSGTLIRYAYMRGYFASASGGSCPYMQSIGYWQPNRDGYECDLSSYSWTNTNRTDGMSSVLSNISSYLDSDYFSGTMKCAVAAYVVNDDDESLQCSCAMDWEDQGGESGAYDPEFYIRNVPFTYSNGNVTYTLSTSSSGALGRVPKTVYLPPGIVWSSSSVHVRLGLMFMGVTVEA